MLNKGDSHYIVVTPGKPEVKEQIPAEGSTWEVVQFTGCGGQSVFTTAKLVWDFEGKSEEILAATHGDANCTLVRQVVGDGKKRLALVLENNSEHDLVLGGRYEAREL
jgi:hypothetical protein